MHAVSENHVTLDAPFGNIPCDVTLHGTLSTNGDAGLPAAVSLSTTNTGVKWTNCGNDTFATLASGSLSIDENRVVRSTGLRVTTVHLGAHCIFETSNTVLGALTTSAEKGGSTATLRTNATIPRTGGSGGIFCGSSTPWTGAFKVETPAAFNLDK
jgi:hypothetical protein